MESIRNETDTVEASMSAQQFDQFIRSPISFGLNQVSKENDSSQQESLNKGSVQLAKPSDATAKVTPTRGAPALLTWFSSQDA